MYGLLLIEITITVLINNNLDAYTSQGITKEYFKDYQDEFDFICTHFRTYGKVPDWETFMGKFPDFDVVQVLEPINYIIYNLKENYLFEKGFKVFQDSANIL